MFIRHFYLLLFVFFFAGCTSTNLTSATHVDTDSWVLVYANDAEGTTVDGSKDALIAAVRDGKPVRIYTAGRTIEHSADAQFLSIYEGEVFAQITPINSQKPEKDPTRILFRQPGQQWRSIVGSNGFVTALMDGGEPRVRTGATRWFVQK